MKNFTIVWFTTWIILCGGAVLLAYLFGGTIVNEADPTITAPRWHLAAWMAGIGGGFGSVILWRMAVDVFFPWAFAPSDWTEI